MGEFKKNSGKHDKHGAELTRSDEGLSRRDFFKTGAAASAGVVALSAPTQAQPASHAEEIPWDYEADVVVVGGGCTGLPAAIRATDLGTSVLVVEQNFDVGGRMLHSGGQISLGGGDPLQLRDIAGESDPEGFITVPPVEAPEELTEDVDFLFGDMTDWSIVDASAQAPYRYNDRELHRAWADNCFDARNFLMDNYVRMGRISGTHGNGGAKRARRAASFLMLGSLTDIKKGIVAQEDAGIEEVSSSLFAPRIMQDASAVVGPGAVRNGAALSRCLEFSAREKGVAFMLNRHMDEIIRESPHDGRVLGIKASYSPRHDPNTGGRLESLWSNGNIDERRETVYIRARKAVVIGAGGHAGNPEFRQMFYPAMREPAFPTSGWALLGDKAADASGIKAGMRVGANLAGMQQNLSYPTTFHVQDLLATQDAYTDMYPGHPTFPFRGSTGIAVGGSGFEHFIAVNQVGKRFYDEIQLGDRHSSNAYPAGPGDGTPRTGLELKTGDWRNCSKAWIREMYDRNASIDAALAMNEGSQHPDYFSGPIWAIFDQSALDRTGWPIGFPYTADNGYFFQAETQDELAEMIYQGHEYQRVRMPYLAETVERWNGFVDAGVDEDFDRHTEEAPIHRIDTPPFFAASIMIIWHDCYGGLRINGRAQVIDLDGKVMPGLYAGGESSGGGNQHGLGRCLVHGYIAGSNVVKEPVVKL